MKNPLDLLFQTKTPAKTAGVDEVKKKDDS
jgi:hypothetical protein